MVKGLGVGIRQLKILYEEEFLWVFLSLGEVLALADRLYLVSSCLIVLYAFDNSLMKRKQ